MFKIIDDDVYFNGYVVARFCDNLVPTVRQDVVETLQEYDDEGYDCEACADLETERDELQRKNGVYAAILGVEL